MSTDLGRPQPPRADAYRSVLLVLAAGSALWTAGLALGGLVIGNPALLDAAVALGVAAGMLLGVASAEAARAAPVPAATEAAEKAAARARLRLRAIKTGTVLAASLAILGALFASGPLRPPSLLDAAFGLFALAGTWLFASAARYLASVDPVRLPEAAGMARGARVMAWVLVAAAIAVALQGAGSKDGVRILHALVLTLDVVLCVDLSSARIPEPSGFPTDLHTFSLLGSRAHPLGSALDAAERQLGIDLRSTWALTVVRRSAEPLLVAVCLVGWLATSLTVVAPDEQGLVERLGVPLAGAPLGPGLHLHWPWPLDQVARISVRRLRTLHVGHGEEEPGSGPEDVLWARQHSANEYTLLLGNGRDLISIDAAVQYRVADPYAWRYHNRSPADALRAIAYRAVMKSTVSRTLTETLSENVAVLTAQMRSDVQADADALGLGVEITTFTIGGMHPPVGVAGDYQAVVSAQLGKTTASVAAQAYRNGLVPKAEAEAYAAENAARADGAEDLGKAAGEAFAFRKLESVYRAAPGDYRFRRRLEALETQLDGRPFTVLDERIQRDGGELWLMR
jgi:regulator of protease activity HflC (stomatin/prohibitin superfamily)